jgi:succinate-semialdehyde dehydrogenase / glutarate-semialdehyde dehydrogenase
MRERELFIGGAWRAAKSGRRLEIHDPATGERVGSTSLADAADVDLAVAAAKRALPGWAEMHADARARILHRAADLIVERIATIADLLTREQGKPVPDAEKEIRFGVEVIRYYAEEGRRLGGTMRASARTDVRSLVVSSPVGVVGAITPWNYPVDIYAWKLGPALAAGCSLIVKPPHETPLAVGMSRSALLMLACRPGS